MMIYFQHCQGFKQFVIKSIATFPEYGTKEDLPITPLDTQKHWMANKYCI